MNDSEFDDYFNSLTAENKMRLLGEKVRGVVFQNGNSYTICNYKDLSASLEQELYEQLTGKE